MFDLPRCECGREVVPGEDGCAFCLDIHPEYRTCSKVLYRDDKAKIIEYCMIEAGARTSHPGQGRCWQHDWKSQDMILGPAYNRAREDY